MNTPPPRFVDADALRRAVTLYDLIEPTAAALAEFSQGLGEAPVTVFAPQGAAGDVHVKSAWLAGHSFFIVKVASWFEARAAQGSPAASGHIAIHSARTGDLVAVLQDEHYLTDIRTGATGAAAARLLARPDSTRLAVLGTGPQGRHQVAAACAVRPIDTVVIWGRRTAAAETMREDILRASPELNVLVAADARSAVRGADVIVTATSSREAILRGAWLEPGQHVTAVGADDPAKAELDPACFARADAVVVDSRDSAPVLAGDLRRAIGTQAISAQDIHAELGDIVSGRRPGRRDTREITIAKLIGLGVQDLAAAEVALGRLEPTAGTQTR
jgi:ornithine cyclodeaminase/alanine dehydrogenase-like protein (mu-crystallin family)